MDRAERRGLVVPAFVVPIRRKPRRMGQPQSWWRTHGPAPGHGLPPFSQTKGGAHGSVPLVMRHSHDGRARTNVAQGILAIDDDGVRSTTGVVSVSRCYQRHLERVTASRTKSDLAAWLVLAIRIDHQITSAARREA
jgi:hypothetical protein